MKRILALLLALAALLAVGCSGAAGGGAPKATAPELKYDFGDIPTTADPKYHEFFIKNEGGSDLKISGAQVKLLQGCWPPKVTVGSTVVKPGKQTSFNFMYHMGPGMGGPHRFQVIITTNDPANPQLVYEVTANSIDKK